MSVLGKRKNNNDNDNNINIKKQKTYDLLDLYPFSDLILNPPIIYYSYYTKLTSYLSQLISDFENNINKNNKFIIDNNNLPLKLLDDLGLSEDTSSCWRQILDYINNCSSDNYNDLWNKIITVDNIITLNDISDNILVYEGQNELWFVKQVNSWFSNNSTNSNISYLKMGLNALILECFYRFIWARYTFKLYHFQEQSYNSSNSNDNINNINKDDVNEVIDNTELGISSDDEDDNNQNNTNNIMDIDNNTNNIMNNNYYELPNVVDLFFCQYDISKSIDEIESLYFKEHNNLQELSQKIYWNIKPAIDTLIKLAIDKSKNNTNNISNNNNILSENICVKKIIKPYLSKHVPFLRKMGIYVNPNNPYEWKWSNNIDPTFIDEIYINTFVHLNFNGDIGRSSQILRLFPNLIMKADSSANIQIPKVIESVEELINEQDKNSKEIKQVIQALTELLEEKRKLELSLNNTTSLSNIQNILNQSKYNRLKELNTLIESLQNEFNRLTINIDNVIPKRRIKTIKKLIPKKKNIRNRGLFPSEFVLSLDSVFRILKLANITSTTNILSLGTLDVCLPLTACYFLSSNILSYCCSISEGKVVSNRISKCIQYIEKNISLTIYNILKKYKNNINDIYNNIKNTLLDNIYITSNIETKLNILIQEYFSLIGNKNSKKYILLHANNLIKYCCNILHHNYIPTHSNTINSMLQVINNIDDNILSNNMNDICIMISSSTLWDIIFKDSYKDIFIKLQNIMEKYIDKCRILVINKIDTKEYANNIWKYIPWNLDSRGRLLEHNTFTIHQNEKNKILSYTDSYDWYYELLRRDNNQEEKKYLKSYKQQSRDFSILYPKNRTPIFPHHFVISSLHITEPQYDSVEDDEEEINDFYKKIWNFSFKQKISNKYKLYGTTIIGIWEMEYSTSYKLFSDTVYRKRKLWEEYIYNNIILKGLSMKESILWIIDSLENSILRDLIKDYEGFFIISDHPGRCSIISTKSYIDNIRFYSIEQIDDNNNNNNNMNNDDIHLLFSDEDKWQTIQISFPPIISTHCNDKIIYRSIENYNAELNIYSERLWKYCIFGNSEFWNLIRNTSITNLNNLRSIIETQIFGSDINDIIIDSQIGPIPCDILKSEIANDILQESKQTRLISPLEEWFYKQKSNTIQNIKQICITCLMNISLEDPTNFEYWNKKYKLNEDINNYNKFTAPDSIPIKYKENIKDMNEICKTIQNTI